MRYNMVILLCTLLTGCGAASVTTAKWRGYSEVCIDGITYLQFSFGATVKVDMNGKPVSCKGE